MVAGFMDNYGSDAGFTLPGMNNDGGENWADIGRWGSSPGGPDSSGGGDFNWGLNPETFGAVGQGLQGLTSLAQIYGMFKNLGLQKKAFKFAQEGTKRNFNAQATGFNNQVIKGENVQSRVAASNPSADFSSLQGYGQVEKWT
jgi:hypothetical protein